MPPAGSFRIAVIVWMAAFCGGSAFAANDVTLPQWNYSVDCPEPGWDALFGTFSLSQTSDALQADIRVFRCDAPTTRGEIDAWLAPGRILIAEGANAVSQSFGFVSSGAPLVEARNVKDRRAPELLIVWETPIKIPPTRLPPGARVLMEERWSGAPLVAVLPLPKGAVLWLAVSPGEDGYNRFPLLANALQEAGFHAPFRSRRLWAFLDSAYRQRVDLDYLASRWERFGIAALHVSAWQHWEQDADRDRWLRRLIEACHRRGILVYAWFEFPHVSEQFWAEHPECREQTALMQDAHLDWRKLIDLSHPRCSRLVEEGAASVLGRFSWDGVNLAEIYYESLEGPQNPARFTPMSSTVRGLFAEEAGFDPGELFDANSPHYFARNHVDLDRFLAWRRRQIARLHETWLRFVARIKTTSQDLHVVVTQIDDQFDGSVRSNLGSDSNEILKLMHQHPFTFLIEDPATIWHLGPARYRDISRAYAKATPYPERLAVDINIFPRYQEVYPTRRQTGLELYRLVHSAAHVFPRVALYFEHVLAEEDLPFLSAAALPEMTVKRGDSRLIVESSQPVGVAWQAPALVDGRAWAAKDGETVWLPSGRHTLERGTADPRLLLSYLSGEIRQLRDGDSGLELHYRSEARTIAILNQAPAKLWVDGEQIATPVYEAACGYYLLLPAGEHLVRVEAGSGVEASH